MKIVTDSGADLTAADLADLGVTVAPLYIGFPDGELPSSAMTPDEFYDRLAAMAPDIPTTAQPSAGEFSQLYDTLAADGDEVLSVHISSGLSGTVQSACLGAEHCSSGQVTVVDSMTLAGGERFQVLAAVMAARKGWSVAAILERLSEIRAATEVVFTLETLEYLAKGGRIGRVSALAGALLHIKPVIHVEAQDGKYSTVGKARTLKKAEARLVAFLAERYAQEPLWVSVQHGQFAQEATQVLATLRQSLNVVRDEMIRVSPVLGVHTGPGIVGVSAVPMRCFEGLL